MGSHEEESLKRIEAELAAIRKELSGRAAPPSGVLRFQEVADYLRVSVRTVQRLVRAGELVTVMVGTSPRIRRAEVERLMTPRTPSMGEGRPVARVTPKKAKARRMSEAERIRALARPKPPKP